MFDMILTYIDKTGNKLIIYREDKKIIIAEQSTDKILLITDYADIDFIASWIEKNYGISE